MTGTQVYSLNAENHRNLAAKARADSASYGRNAHFEIRFKDYKLQADISSKDIQKADRDIAGADIQIAIAELERDLQRRRIDNAKAIRTALKSKLTSEEFHLWRISQLQPMRYQQYRIAYDLAAQCKAALAQELGLDDDSIMPDTWDNAHHGVGAALGLISELLHVAGARIGGAYRGKLRRECYWKPLQIPTKPPQNAHLQR